MALRKSGPPADRPFSTDAGRSIDDSFGAKVMALADKSFKPRKYTALLDAATDARFGRLLDRLQESAGPIATRSDGNGRTRAGYDLSRADLLRALLEVAEDSDLVMTEVQAKVRAHYGATS